MGVKVAYFVFRYPTLTQTFIQREVAGLLDHGLKITVCPLFSMKLKPGEPEPPAHEGARYGSWGDVVLFPFRLLRELLRSPRNLFGALAALVRYRPRTFEAWVHTFLGVVCAVNRAGMVRRGGYGLAHGAWATGPATAAMALSRLCGIPFSFGGHAYDIYRFGGDPFLDLKLEHAQFVHTTTEANVKYLSERSSRKDLRIVLARRGLSRMPEERKDKARSGFEEKRVELISVGRLVEKKGQVFQLQACSILRERGVSFHLTIIGEGPLRKELEAEIAKRGLEDVVSLPGAMDPQEVAAAYAKAHVFLHTGVVDREGDRDGLPNVIPEAFANRLVVIGSLTAGVLEAVKNEETGLVVDPTRPGEIADAIVRVREDQDLRNRLAETGRAWAEEHFSASKNTGILAEAMKVSSTPV